MGLAEGKEIARKTCADERTATVLGHYLNALITRDELVNTVVDIAIEHGYGAGFAEIQKQDLERR